MAEKLKPCPHCDDSEPELHDDEGYNYFVICLYCLLRGPSFSTLDVGIDDDPKQHAMTAWNNLPRRNEWKPIETAPNDGTPVLLWGKFSNGRIFDRTRVVWAAVTKTIHGDAQFWNVEGCKFTHCVANAHPTHWMPLPKPPEDE